jgi:hypothetical protein
MMNERTRELAEQARKYARDYVAECKHYGHYMEHNEHELRFEEKFAELIVEECCSKLKEMGESWHEFAKNPPDGQAHNANRALFAAYRLKEDAVDEIKQHFGVEE